MPYEVELKNGLFIQVPNLKADGSNWNTYRVNLLSAASVEGFTTLYDGTETPPDLAMANNDKRRAWAQRNAEARCLIITTSWIQFYSTFIPRKRPTKLSHKSKFYSEARLQLQSRPSVQESG